MKKLICLLLCLMLTLTCATAMAKVEYTLMEKWQRQVDFGNGIKGTLKLNVSGQADWAKLLAPISDIPMEIRAIHDDESFQYRMYVENGEELLGLTQLYGDEQTVYLQSELLPDTLLSLPTGGDVLNRLAGVTAEESPSLYSAMLNILNVPQTTWEGKWLPALDAYSSAIELWLENYASAPSVLRADDGSATVLVRYEIPADGLKSQIKALWANVLQDATLLPLLKGQLNQAQQEAYLNTSLQYYYDQVIDGLPLSGSVILEREMTAKGDALRTAMTFPLAQDGWSSLTIRQADGVTSLDVQGTDKQLALELTETLATGSSAAYQGRLRYVPADKSQEAVAAAFSLVKTQSSSVDEDTRSHDRTVWTLNVEPDAEYTGEGWTDIQPMEINLSMHLHSKSQQSNPVTVEVNLAVKLAEAEIAVDLSLMTRSKWVMDNLPTEGALDVTTLPAEELTQKLADLGLNGLTMVQRLNQENASPEEPAAEATAEPVPATATELTDKPTEKPSAEATAEPTEAAS